MGWTGLWGEFRVRVGSILDSSAWALGVRALNSDDGNLATSEAGAGAAGNHYKKPLIAIYIQVGGESKLDVVTGRFKTIFN